MAPDRACCGLMDNTGFTFTQRESIGRMTAKSNAVLANSRLAVMEIIGMFFQGASQAPRGWRRVHRRHRLQRDQHRGELNAVAFE